MLERLASHNDDIKRLFDRGHPLAVDSDYLVVRDIPYLDASGGLQWGAFVTKLVFVDQHRVTQDDHQVWFAGGVPHNLDGTPAGLWRRMAAAPALSLLLLLAVLQLRPAALVVAAPFLLAWVLSPLVAYQVSRPLRPRGLEESRDLPEEERALRAMGERGLVPRLRHRPRRAV